MQAHFMGMRPEGWLELMAAEKARRRRRARTRWMLAGFVVVTGIAIAACVVLLSPAAG